MKKKLWIVLTFMCITAFLYSFVDQHLRLLMPTEAGPWIVMIVLTASAVLTLMIADTAEWD